MGQAAVPTTAGAEAAAFACGEVTDEGAGVLYISNIMTLYRGSKTHEAERKLERAKASCSSRCADNRENGKRVETVSKNPRGKTGRRGQKFICLQTELGAYVGHIMGAIWRRAAAHSRYFTKSVRFLGGRARPKQRG